MFLSDIEKKKGLPVENEDLIEIYEDQLKPLGLIALNGLYEDSMYFEDKKLSNKDAGLPGFEFLSAQPGSSKRRPCMYYGFMHKSFQEFFAGYYLRCQLVSKETSPEKLVTDTRYFGELREVLKFTCGLLAVTSKEIAEALIISMANKLNNENVRGCLPVALECIKECRIESSNFHMELPVHLAHVSNVNGLRILKMRKVLMTLLLLCLLPYLKQTRL